MATGPMRGVLRHLRGATLLRDAADVSDGQLLERFLARRDEAAFEALVRRHGPMVLGVCRRVLRDAHDAEDAFQATFLVLVRKARSVVPRERVGNWLHGVAYRTALRARSAATLRRAKERQSAGVPREQAPPGGAWEEVLPLLDRELHGLPEKYRVAIVLCDLQGKTRREAARQLGWPEGTLSCRLARGRDLLARRLSRHGVQVSGAALALGLARGTAAVPASLLAQSTAAVLAGAVPAGVAALTQGVLKAMLLTRLKIGAALVLALGFVVAGAGALQSPGAAAGEGEVKASAALAPAAGKPAGRPPQRRHEVKGEIRRDGNQEVWTLDFRFREPRLCRLAAPGRGDFWYLSYDIVNATGKPRTFFPNFELVVTGGPGVGRDLGLLKEGRPLPLREFRALNREEMQGEVRLARLHESIRQLEDPERLLGLKDAITVADAPVPPAGPDGAARGVHALAVWEGVPADVEGFTVFVGGLSNAWVVVDKETIRRKALRLEFRREGKEMRFVPPAEWVYRGALRVPSPEKLQEKEKAREDKQGEQIRMYKTLMDLARLQWAGTRPAFQKVLREIENAMQQVRQEANGEASELELLQEVERVVKELQDRVRRGRKELEKLQGIWATRKVHIAGAVALPPEILPLPLASLGNVAVVGNRFITRGAGQDPAKLPTLRLDPTSKPAAIDFRLGDRVIRAVYELEGDTLRIGFGEGKGRPASLEGRDAVVVVTYHRKKL